MTDKTLDLHQLRLFIAAARHLSVKAAAQELDLSPSAVSQAVSSLEASLGTPLFLRTVRPLELTFAGRTLLSEGSRLLSDEARLRSLLASPKSAFQSLRLGVSEAVTSSIGPWLLKSVGDIVPDLSVFSDLAPVLQKKLAQGDVDVMLSSSNAAAGADWHREEVWREDFLLVTAASLPDVRTLQDLQKLAQSSTFVCYNPNYLDQQRTESILSEINLTPARRLPVSSSYEVMGLIALSGGFGLLPPTNIWCGRVFFPTVRVQPIPAACAPNRRMWATGKASSALAQTKFIAAQARQQFAAFVQNALTPACPGLSRYLHLANALSD